MAIIELPDRRAVANFLPADSVGCEIGIRTGEFSELLVRRAREFHGIDWWTKSNQLANLRETEKRLRSHLDAGIATLHDEDVAVVLPSFPDAYFDWIYVDGDHWYASVVRDISIALLKIKPGGLLCGHDFVFGRNHWGTSVIRAVLEHIQARRIDIVALSRDQFVDWVARVV